MLRINDNLKEIYVRIIVHEHFPKFKCNELRYCQFEEYFEFKSYYLKKKKEKKERRRSLN